MNFDSSEYFAYKKNKLSQEMREMKKPISRLSFLCQIFIATFVIMFIIIVITIMKYSSKMDIEYTKGELQLSNGAVNNIAGFDNVQVDDDRQRKIDKRLILIQQEENAPSEARIVNKPKMNMEVIDASHVEKNKKLDKLERQKKLNQESETKNSKLSTILEEVNFQKKIPVENNLIDSNVTVMSKVLVGRYPTFEEAQKVQTQIKAKSPSLQPFVKKIGNVFSVQMGSYQDFAQAKTHAQALRGKGFDVWIYQQ
ncbi:MAG: SPOR domain-containing protein [Candidatus Gastranaerophilales bacterium]|nr:SPOR domain-containing protein [Candidatus Gastranaerophilales bacterium]